jgi:hypothetical protein
VQQHPVEVEQPAPALGLDAFDERREVWTVGIRIKDAGHGVGDRGATDRRV